MVLIFGILNIIPRTLKKIIYIFKNADNIFILLFRMVLLGSLVFGFVFFFTAKQYNYIKKGFYFEKSYSEKVLLEKMYSYYPKNSTAIDVYVKALKNAGADCKKELNVYNCSYTKNLLFKKEQWNVALNVEDNKVVSIAISKKNDDVMVDFMNNTNKKVKDQVHKITK